MKSDYDFEISLHQESAAAASRLVADTAKSLRPPSTYAQEAVRGSDSEVSKVALLRFYSITRRALRKFS